MPIAYHDWESYLGKDNEFGPAETLLQVVFALEMISVKEVIELSDITHNVILGLPLRDLDSYLELAAIKTREYLDLYEQHGRKYHDKRHPLVQLLNEDAIELLSEYKRNIQDAIGSCNLAVEEEQKYPQAKLLLNLLLAEKTPVKNQPNFVSQFLIQLYHDCLHHLGVSSSKQVTLLRTMRNNVAFPNVKELIRNDFNEGGLAVTCTQTISAFKGTSFATAGELAACLIYPDGKGGYDSELKLNGAGIDELASIVYVLNNELTPEELVRPDRLRHWLKIAVFIALTVPFRSQEDITLLAHNLYMMLQQNEGIKEALKLEESENLESFVRSLISEGLDFAEKDIGNFLLGGDQLYFCDREIAKEFAADELEGHTIDSDIYKQLFISMKALAGCVSEEKFRKMLNLPADIDVGYVGFIHQKMKDRLVFHRGPTDDEITSGVHDKDRDLKELEQGGGLAEKYKTAEGNLSASAERHLDHIKELFVAITKAYYGEESQVDTQTILQSTMWENRKKNVVECIMSKGKTPEKFLAPHGSHVVDGLSAKIAAYLTRGRP